jgi:hypothetical protein
MQRQKGTGMNCAAISQVKIVVSATNVVHGAESFRSQSYLATQEIPCLLWNPRFHYWLQELNTRPLQILLLLSLSRLFMML